MRPLKPSLRWSHVIFKVLNASSAILAALTCFSSNSCSKLAFLTFLSRSSLYLCPTLGISLLAHCLYAAAWPCRCSCYVCGTCTVAGVYSGTAIPTEAVLRMAVTALVHCNVLFCRFLKWFDRYPLLICCNCAGTVLSCIHQMKILYHKFITRNLDTRYL